MNGVGHRSSITGRKRDVNRDSNWWHRLEQYVEAAPASQSPDDLAEALAEAKD